MKCLLLLSETRLLPVCPCTKGDCCMPAFESCSKMRAALCVKEHKLGQNPLVPAKMRGRPPHSNSFISLVLIPAKADGNKKQKLPLHRGLYVKQGQEMLMWFLQLQLAGLLPTGLQYWMPVVPVSGRLGSTHCWQSGQHESGFIWPDTTCGSPWEKEIPSCFQGQLEVLSSCGMVQGELNLDVISGIWPEISSSAQEIVCLSLSKHFWLSLLKSFI